MKRFERKVAMVTGAGRGIGQAIALAFAREGAAVAAFTASNAATIANKLKALDGDFRVYTEDFSKLTQARAGELINQVVGDLGSIDVLVNNAGIIKRAPIHEHPEADWHAVLEINLNAPFFLTQAVAQWWLTTGRVHAAEAARCKVVNIASMLSFQGGILVPGYTASKSALAGVTKAFANELARERMNFNAVAPGYIATDNTSALRADAARNQAILNRIPEGRWGSPDDIVGAILFLASSEADYLNGTILNVDGGWLAR